ncbi:hypothetical protein SmJEL517_g02289 [Synchytrium microbalum]|uniref:Uncharacterized protein n=1 Tax=Synchytrium microbalum TaxID=1806994 RepID=A0A507C858_9FUNG|nr:uncharacterized protein SmJEL517_g02289 [Synchytrium microbalum]TPX35329.1 hypothetical protein SmJEL517_g02289 [Synchytrium microbalum]
MMWCKANRPIWTLLITLIALLVAATAKRAPQDQGLQQDLSLDICNPDNLVVESRCNIELVETIHSTIAGDLKDLVGTSLFRYFKINLHKDCPHWAENMLCFQRDCEVETTDEDEVPDEWKSKQLSTVTFNNGHSFKPFSKCTDKDFCLWDDETSNDGEYVNLLQNPERFTGYTGASAARVWKAIYEENCFNVAESDLKNHLEAARDSEQCLEKRVFYRLISGLHSSISTHLCNEYLDRKTGVWFPNLTCFMERVGMFPDRVQNMYFNYVVLLRSIGKLGPVLDSFDLCASGANGDSETIKTLLKSITKKTCLASPPFDESALFRGPDAVTLKKEFRDHFRNITGIMDCVGCEKCRLWGKIQTLGLGTALKILFSFDTPSEILLTRQEIVALFNAFGRISESIAAIGTFREQHHAETQQQQLKEQPKETVTNPIPVVNSSSVSDAISALSSSWVKGMAITLGLLLGIYFAYRNLIQGKKKPSNTNGIAHKRKSSRKAD